MGLSRARSSPRTSSGATGSTSGTRETGEWHSLHLRSAEYAVEGVIAPGAGRGGLRAARERRSRRRARSRRADDLYLHEAIARWAGWSLAVEMPGKHLSRYADPDKAIPQDGDDPDYRRTSR